jgi:NADPH-dependent curcumin reductase CurA
MKSTNKSKKKKLTKTGDKVLSNETIKEAAIKSENELKKLDKVKKGAFTEWQ